MYTVPVVGFYKVWGALCHIRHGPPQAVAITQNEAVTLSALSSGGLDAGQGVNPASMVLYSTAVWIQGPGQGTQGHSGHMESVRPLPGSPCHLINWEVAPPSHSTPASYLPVHPRDLSPAFPKVTILTKSIPLPIPTTAPSAPQGWCQGNAQHPCSEHTARQRGPESRSSCAPGAHCAVPHRHSCPGPLGPSEARQV